MPNLNKAMIIGTLTRDPETKHTPKGTVIASFSLAVNRNYTTESGEKREEATFLDCEAWGKLAEIVGQYCKKGGSIYVEGRLKVESWDDKETGKKRSKTKIVVENMQLLGGKRQESAPAPQQREGVRPTDPDLDAQPDEIPF